MVPTGSEKVQSVLGTAGKWVRLQLRKLWKQQQEISKAWSEDGS